MQSRSILRPSPALNLLFCCLLVQLLASSNGLAGPPARFSSSFDDNWQFHLGDLEGAEQTEYNDGDWRTLDLPHDWSVEQDFSPTNASGTGYLPGGIGWYRKAFTLPDTTRGRRVIIEFDGVYRNSDVWINGHHLGTRPNGYIGFQYDLTPHVRFGTNANVVAVRVNRVNVADSRWYPGTGIYRHVRLVEMNPIHIAPWGVFVTTPRIETDSADIDTAIEVMNESDAPATVRVLTQVLAPDQTVVSEGEETHSLSAGKSFTLSTWQKVARPELWSPSSPTLYTLVARVFADEQLVDDLETPFGFREFHFEPDTGFFLNGTNLLLKGVCMHHDAGVVGAAVPVEVLERRLRLVKDLGANAVRCSHNPMSPELYALCDQLGLLVMDEAFDEWEIGKRKWVEGRNVGTAERYGYAEAFTEWGERDLGDMVRQHRNHPSIILWSIGNEIDYPTDPYVHPESRIDPDFADFSGKGMPSVTRLSVVAPRLISTVKRQDPTRPVTMALANVPAANGIGLADMLDVAGYNYQEKEYERDHRTFPARVIYGSENSRSPQSWRVVLDNDYISGLFLWVGFDFLGEADRWPNVGSRAGVFDRCGFPKISTLHFEALWREEPVVRLVTAPVTRENNRRRYWSRLAPHWTWTADQNDPMSAIAFSNCEEVELQLNGRSLGRKTPDENGAVRWQLGFEAGELTATGFIDGEPRAREMLQTAGAPVGFAAKLDKDTLEPHGVAHVILQAIDAQGVAVPRFEAPVTVTVDGAGKLLGLDNADQNDTTPLRSPSREPRDGRLLALIQAAGTTGTITVTAEAEGLEPLELQIQVD